MNQRQIKFFVIANIVAGLLPAFVQIAFVLSGGRFYILAYFIQANLVYVAQSVFSTIHESVSRLSSLKEMSISLITMALVFKFNRMDSVLRFVLIGLAFIAVMLSGFRSTLLTVMILVGVWFFMRGSVRERVIMIGGGAICAVLGWFMLFLFIDKLPQSMMRAVSWVPGLDVPYMVANDARGTLEWRWEIWRYMLDDIPNYFFIGKGFCFPPDYLITSDIWEGSKPHAHFLIHNYHSGPLGLLLDLGLPGLITGTLFMIVSSREHIRGIKRFRGDTMMSRYYQLLTIIYVWGCLSFFMIHGDARSSIITMMLSGTLLRVLRYSVEQQEKSLCA